MEVTHGARMLFHGDMGGSILGLHVWWRAQGQGTNVAIYVAGAHF
jgi:hypothetical protein